MCPCSDDLKVKACYIAEDIIELVLPLENLPELGDRGHEDGIIGYILISNGHEITIINNEEEYYTWLNENNY